MMHRASGLKSPKRSNHVTKDKIITAGLRVCSGGDTGAGRKSGRAELYRLPSVGWETIWGTIVPGSQTDGSVEISTGNTVWHVRYDQESSLEGFKSMRELRDEKAVSVTFTKNKAGNVYADEVNYKPGYHFHTLDNIITISEIGDVLKQSPEEGNYMIVDARGYDNFIEGHLPNAVNIPYYRLLEFKDRLPKDKNTNIIAYCRGST